MPNIARIIASVFVAASVLGCANGWLESNQRDTEPQFTEARADRLENRFTDLLDGSGDEIEAHLERLIEAMQVDGCGDWIAAISLDSVNWGGEVRQVFSESANCHQADRLFGIRYDRGEQLFFEPLEPSSSLADSCRDAECLSFRERPSRFVVSHEPARYLILSHGMDVFVRQIPRGIENDLFFEIFSIEVLPNSRRNTEE